MDYLYKLRSAVSTVKSTVESALPGNPISREYDTTNAVASAGPSLCWTIYDGYKKSNKQEVSVWWLEKRHIEKWPPRDRDLFLEVVKRGIQRLTRLRHPRLLVVEHGLEEAKDSLAFCTEPVLASLANILYPPTHSGGGINDDPSTAPAITEAAVAELRKFSLEDIEMKMGCQEIAEALRFLHFDARMIHRNVSPESILITKRNAWKLAGFEFCLTSTSTPDQPPSYPNVDYDTQLPSFARPRLDFAAPELPLGGRIDVASDIYSYGLVLYCIFNKGKRLLEYKDDLSAFRKNSENMKTLPVGKLITVPEVIREDLKLCLQFTPELRPDAAQLLLIRYFDDPNVKTLTSLESLRLIDGSEKASFFKSLPATFSSFPKRVLTHRILPSLADEMRLHPQTVPLVLPSVLQASELLDENEFSKFALPSLEPVLQLERAYQAWHLVLQKAELILCKLSTDDARRVLVPMACNALESDSATLHETCCQCLHKMTALIDPDSMRKRIVPRLLALATDMNVLSVRVNALLCLGRMLDKLEKWQVTEQILPALAKIQSRDPAILMAVLGVFRLSFNCSKLGGLGRDICAKVCLPFLVTSCVEQALNGRQFEAFMSLIRDMLNKVEAEQRRRLDQTPVAESTEDSAHLNNVNHTGMESKGSNSNLASLVNASSKAAPTEKRGGSLTLEEKRRLAAEQEKTLQLRQSTPLEPINTTVKATPSSTATASLTGLLSSPPTSSTALSSILTPQNFSMLPSQPIIQQHHSKATSPDPFASLNAFAMTQPSRIPMSSPTGPARQPSPVSPPQQQLWPSGFAAIRPPPPPPQIPLNTGGTRTLNSMVIPPPPGPTAMSQVKQPNLGTSGSWNQTYVSNVSANPQGGTSLRPKAHDELTDLLG